VAEGGGLLNRYTVNIRIVGSNPIPSATLAFLTRNINRLTCTGTRDPGRYPYHKRPVAGEG
jgi:hypothetical protein